MKEGRIFNIEKYAIHDGPGIRTTIFFKGCPLRCWWCHNPEGQDFEPELVYREGRCIGCGECIKTCSRRALSLADQRVSLDRERCNACGECVQVCPSEALSIAGRDISADEAIRELERDRVFYDESEGGVTFSGGEPLLQPNFLDALLSDCSKRDIHTVLDTSGYAPFKVIERVRGRVDLFLYDIKTMNESSHRKYVGVSSKLILQNLKKLGRTGSCLAISLPVIPGINDDPENLRATGECISSLPSVEYVSLLPYHRAGIEKYRNLGKPYRLMGTKPPSPGKLQIIKERLEAFGLNVKVGGR